MAPLPSLLLLPLLPLLPLLLLLPLPPLAAAAFVPLGEPLTSGRPVRIPVSGASNGTSYRLDLDIIPNDTRRLSVDLAFEPPSVQPRLHFPRPVALLHNSTTEPPLLQVPRLLSNLSQLSYPTRRDFLADTDAYKARLLRSTIVSSIRPEMVVSVYNVAVLERHRPFPNGTLTLTLHNDNQPVCGGSFNEGQCNSRGNCTASGQSASARCDCELNYTGRTCTESYTTFSEGGKNKNFDADDLNVEPSSLEQQYVVIVRPFETVYVAFDPSELALMSGSSHEFSVRILRGSNSADDERMLQCEIAFAQHARSTTLPNWGTDRKSFESIGDSSSSLQANVKFTVRGSLYMIALFANASHTVEGFKDYAAFAITAPRQITQSSPVPRQRFLPQAMLPVCLSLIFVAGLAVLLVFWLDRRSGRSKMVDRLSEAELLRMYPAYVAERNEGECPICLSDMQPGDSLRALRCEHHFHAECLDPWVCENRANCPTCRATVRVDHLSDNHREPVCSRNRSCWRCLFCVSRDNDNGEDGQDVREPEGLQEQEMEEQQRSLEPQPELLHNGIRIAFPDRVQGALQVRTASSTPRTQSTTHAVSETGSEGASMHTALDLSFGSSRREQRLAEVSHDPP